MQGVIMSGRAAGLQARSALRGALFVFACTTVVLSLRLLLGGFGFDTVWAEDGRVFLRDIHNHGWTSLGWTYAGYAHGLPRLLALAGSALPLESYALFTAAAGIIAVGALAAFVFVASANLLGSERWALVPALGMGLVPAAASDAIGNLANLQWWLLPAAFVGLAIGAASSAALRAGATAVVLLSALTSPLTVLMLPGALTRGRAGLKSPQVIALAAGAGIQAVAIVAAPESDLTLPRHIAVRPMDAARFLSAVLGYAPMQPTAASAGIGLLVAGGIVALAWRGRAAWRLPVLAAAATMALFVVNSVISGSGRYATAAVVILLVGVGALLRVTPRALPYFAAATAGLVALSFPVPAYRASGPAWPQVVDQAERACTDGHETGPLDVGPADWYVGEFTVAC